MPILSILSAITSLITRLQCEWRHLRQVRRQMREIEFMTQRDLADIGMSHTAMVDALRKSGCI
jgi:uncharacterized protein YjiS (DUF1127 family)